MKKNDWIVIVSILLLAAVFYLIFNLKDDKSLRSASVLVDGQELISLELKDIPYEYTVENNYGKNILLIDGSGICVIWSDCKLQTCVNFGKITHSGQVIACLPHHLTIILEGKTDESKDFDAIAN